MDLVRDKLGFAQVATIQPDGQPQLSPVWYSWDGERIQFSTVKGRQKHLNLARDARITFAVLDPDDPYRYLEIRGRASIEDDPDSSLIHALEKRYRGRDRFTGDGPGTERVIVRISVDHVVTRK